MMYVDRAVMGSATPSSCASSIWTRSAWAGAPPPSTGRTRSSRCPAAGSPIASDLVSCSRARSHGGRSSPRPPARVQCASLASRGFVRNGRSRGVPVKSRALVRWLPLHQRGFGQGFQHAGFALRRRTCAVDRDGVDRARSTGKSAFYFSRHHRRDLGDASGIAITATIRASTGRESAEMDLIGAGPQLRVCKAAVPWARILAQPRPLVPERHVLLLRLGALAVPAVAADLFHRGPPLHEHQDRLRRERAAARRDRHQRRRRLDFRPPLAPVGRPSPRPHARVLSASPSPAWR